MPQFARLRKSSSWVTLTCVVVAVALNGLIAICGHLIDMRRLDQIQIAHIETQSTQLINILDDGAHESDVRRFGNVRTQVDSAFLKLRNTGQRDEVASARAAYRQFIVKANSEVAAIERGSASAAHRLEHDSVDPAFASLKAALDTLEEASRAEAEAAIVRIQVVTGVCLVFAALTIGILSSRHRHKALLLQSLEAERSVAVLSERKFRSLVRNTACVIAVTDRQGEFGLVSEVSERLWGLSPKELVGTSVLQLVDLLDAVPLVDAMRQCVAGVDSIRTEVRLRHPSGEFKWFEVQVCDLTSDPDLDGLLLTFHDLTERKHLEGELLHNAFHDRLTGLPNRALFLDRVAHRLKGREGEKCGAVIFIDIDNFKVLNDGLGREAGDQLLLKAAERFRTECRPGDTVARMGGDEFTVLLEEVCTAEEATSAVTRFLATLSAPIRVAEREVFLTASVGIALHLGWDDDSHALMRNAETAMFQAKGYGKNGLAVFAETMDTHSVERVELESDLRYAIERNELTLHYQPIVDIRSGDFYEIEALLRWQHPRRGQIPPMKFVPLAEDSGIIFPIGQWVLRECLSQLTRWDLEYPAMRKIAIAVNVCAKQVEQAGFVDLVRNTLEEFHVAPGRISLEITESAMLKNLDRECAVLQDLREVGVRIAIDDFGTGYSSFAYLSRLPVDILKIDRSFVIPLGRDDRTPGVIRGMVTMAKSLGLRVTTEGIETEPQLDALRSLGCEFGQGYLFSRPVSAVQMAELLASGARVQIAPHTFSA